MESRRATFDRAEFIQVLPMVKTGINDSFMHDPINLLHVLHFLHSLPFRQLFKKTAWGVKQICLLKRISVEVEEQFMF